MRTTDLLKYIVDQIFSMDLRKFLRPVIVLIAALGLPYMAVEEFRACGSTPTWYLTLAGSLLSWMFAEKALGKGVLDEDGRPLK